MGGSWKHRVRLSSAKMSEEPSFRMTVADNSLIINRNKYYEPDKGNLNCLGANYA